MRPVDIVALLAAILAVFTFLSASGALQRGRTGGGVVGLLAGVAFFLAAGVAGTVSVGTDGYRELDTESATLAGTVMAEPLGSDSIRARLTMPDGITHTFRLAGDRVGIGAHILRWKRGGALVERTSEYQLVRLVGRSGSEGGATDSTFVRIALTGPVDLYDVAVRFPALGAVLEATNGEVEIEAGGDTEYRLEVTPAGLRAARPAR